ncbi:MAG: hypothetical protein A3J74_04310 [Elusimicrobia bacterium RIFCSPHIGHO2_02_FULL_57_9]|nr:MAG: hypothetical protein A3J74_04310 [Elusimicrobia bacterium RIFCSPHIGHO2_02_FULL_57_9]
MGSRRLFLLAAAGICLPLLFHNARGGEPEIDADPLVKLPSEEDEPPIHKPVLREKKGLKLVKKTAHVYLSADQGAGTAENPRKWYVSVLSRPPRGTFALETGIFEVFNKPGNDRRPAFPSANIHLANRPFNFDKDDPQNSIDFQLWIYPEPSPNMEKGLYVFKSAGSPGVQPLLWWGIEDSKAFSEGTPEEIERRLAAIFPGK